MEDNDDNIFEFWFIIVTWTLLIFSIINWFQIVLT